MVEWLSDNRAGFAAVIVLLLVAMFLWSIVLGRKQAVLTAKDEVFGDPQRARGGWYWALSGVATLMLIWFYFSWGIGRAYFPTAANEMCQVAKLEEAISPIKAALPIGSRYYKSTLLVARNSDQLDAVEAELPTDAFTSPEQAKLKALTSNLRSLIVNSSDPKNLSLDATKKLDQLVFQLNALSMELRGGFERFSPTAKALSQPKWGTTHVEIPILPITARGMLFDDVATKAREVATLFRAIRNHPPANITIIADVKARIAMFKQMNAAGKFDKKTGAARLAYVKAVERIFRRLDDGTIFPANSLDGLNGAIARLDAARDHARGQIADPMHGTRFCPMAAKTNGCHRYVSQTGEPGYRRWWRIQGRAALVVEVATGR